MKKTARNYERSEMAQSRRMLATETLSSALVKERISMQIALGVLKDSEIFTRDEQEIAEESLDMLRDVEERIIQLFGDLNNANSLRKAKIHLNAKTLAEEISAHRETAFWLTEGDGVLHMERIIGLQLKAYEHVRRLIRVLHAKDLFITTPEDPLSLPAIPANHYLRIADQVLCG